MITSVISLNMVMGMMPIGMFDPLYIGIVGGFMLLGMFVSGRLKRKFAQYSEVPTTSGLSGKEVAEKMLRDNGIYDVRVISVDGQLTDHYDPTKKTVNLSNDVYHGRNVAAAAVAAHECGHAVQHAHAYAWLGIRSKMVPVVNVTSGIMNFIFIASLFLGAFVSMMNQALLFIIICQAVITLFPLVTLPVEFDASRRALAWLNNAGITRPAEHEQATDALKWAALTYVVAALASIGTLLYFILRYVGNNRD